MYDKWASVAKTIRSFAEGLNTNLNYKYQSEILTMNRLQGVFILWVIGLCIATLLFVKEIVDFAYYFHIIKHFLIRYKIYLKLQLYKLIKSFQRVWNSVKKLIH